MGETDVSSLDVEIRADGIPLVEVLDLLDRMVPLAEWPREAAAGLSLAMRSCSEDPREQEKARRLREHLFAGPPPRSLSRKKTGVLPRRGLVTFETALEVIEALAREHLAAIGRPLRSIVAFGGTQGPR